MADFSELDPYAERLRDVCERAGQNSDNETELRLEVEPVIREALEEIYGLELGEIRSERTNEAGQFDTAYGGVVVEYEHEMDGARRRHGAQQALDYLAAERDKVEDEEMFTAVVTDGLQWGFLISDEHAAEQLELISGESTTDDPARRFIWYDNSVEACRRFLALVGSHPQVPVTGKNLVRALGKGSSRARRLISLYLELIHNRQSDGRADTFYLEWRRALEVAYGELDNPDSDLLATIREEYNVSTSGSLGEFLFALHSYFALVARLTAAEVLAISVGEQEARPSTWSGLGESDLISKLEALERGELPPGLDISNLFEGDVFSWYTESLEGNTALLDAVRSLCNTISKFAFPRIAYGGNPAIDILKDLYQGLTTRELRRALGEFLTPAWLAQATLQASSRAGADLSDDRVLDCTCGTGTFLSSVLSARLNSLRQQADGKPDTGEIQSVLNSVVGIDINPVAVVAARMNYLISLGELATADNLYLPVWMADSVLLPEEPPAQREWVSNPSLAGKKYVELPTSLSDPFPVPKVFLSPLGLSRLASVLRTAVREEYSVDEFRSDLAGECGPGGMHPVTEDQEAWDEALDVAAELYQVISELHDEGKDDVWAEIIENRFAPVFMDDFDLVVGNPPWLTFTKLPDQWREKAKPIWQNYGLYDVPEMPGVDEPTSLHTSDMAVLVLAVALDRYLKSDGILSFVTPKALISGDPGNRAFRTYRLSSDRDPDARRKIDVPFKLAEIHDFSDVKPFSADASNLPIVVVAQKGQETGFPIKGRRWFRSQEGQEIPEDSWDNVRRAYLTSESVRWVPVSTYDASPLAWWRDEETPLRGIPSGYTFGKGFDTRGANGVFFVEIRQAADSQGLVRIANIPTAGRDSELREMGPRVGSVESKYVVPAVRGRDLTPFKVDPSAYVVLAHDPDDRSRPLSKKEIQGTRLFRFLRYFKDTLIDRSSYMSFETTEECWWQLQGTNHMDDGYLVCVREIASQPGAAVLRSEWDDKLGRNVLPVPDHKINFFRTDSEDEAYYLAGMVNSAPLQTLLDRFATFTSISPNTLKYLPVPDFSGNNSMHQRIATYSKALHQDNTEPEMKALNTTVEKVLKSD